MALIRMGAIIGMGALIGIGALIRKGALSNGNRTEWSPIRSVIIRVINKITRRSSVTN